MKTSIIVVNYNSRPYLKKCLASILANTAPDFEIIIVDNASSDDSRDFFKGLRDHRVKLIANQQNRGYAEACNQGLKAASGELLVTMNPDVILPPNWLGRMVWHLKQYPKTLVVGPKGIGICGQQSAFPLCFSKNLTAADRKFAKLYFRHSKPSKYLIGCLIFFDRRLLETVGYYDDLFPLGADDFDLSLRVRQAGFELRVACDVLIHHTVHASFNRSPAKDCDYLASLSWEHFNQKWAKELREFGWQNLFENEKPIFPGESPFDQD